MVEVLHRRRVRKLMKKRREERNRCKRRESKEEEELKVAKRFRSSTFEGTRVSTIGITLCVSQRACERV